MKKKGEVVDNIKLSKANVNNVNIVLKDDLSVLSKKIDKKINYNYDIDINDIKYPISKEESIGKINLLNNNKLVKSVDLVTDNDIYKISYYKYIINNLLNLF